MSDAVIRERITAEHEAAHAIAAAAVGAKVDSMRMGFDGIALNGSLGDVWHGRITDPLDFAIVCFSGTIGAAFCEGVTYGLIEPGTHTATMKRFKKIAKQADKKRCAGVEITPQRPQGEMDIKAVERHCRNGGAADVAAAWSLLSKMRDKAAAAALFEQAQHRAMVLVAVNLVRIRALAEALLDRRLLIGADLAGLLAGVKRP